MSKPEIVCLCGSTRFRAEYERANKEETLAGRIVLSVGFSEHGGDGAPSEEVKSRLDELHLRKIDLADEVLFLNAGGYLGDSSLRELAYSVLNHKRIRFLDKDAGEALMEREAHKIGKLLAEMVEKEARC